MQQSFLDFIFILTCLGECNKPRDVAWSNDSLYYSTAVDIACDLLSMCTQSHEVLSNLAFG